MTKNDKIGLPATIVLLLVLSALGYYGSNEKVNLKLSDNKNIKYTIVDYAKQL